MNVFMEFLSEYGPTMLYTIISGIISYIAIRIKNIYTNYTNEKVKESIVKNCVKATEQIYANLSGEQKYEKALEAIKEMMQAKKIDITDFEIKMLVEAACNELNKA